ncbi:putative cytochrome c biogenesis ccmB-like mitochondrial protein [Sesamum angolense]|uniref:Cytochrome c biogenesis ccmB-like mitochondrial protein n=1 Tax=Sesamum angolense TaxID=2727404 RepID=A0AAE1XCL2_9LAMI|nr:putative cytochrome c biogenesis ccmB-like mitochondrial protein [Sesamum angolense]
MLQLPYQFGRSGMDRLNIPLGSLVLTLLCGIHSRSALGITSSSGWNSSQNPTTSPTSLPPTLSRTSIEQNGFMFFHRLVIPLRSYLFFQFRSRLVHKIEWPILLRTLDSIVFQEC